MSSWIHNRFVYSPFYLRNTKHCRNSLSQLITPIIDTEMALSQNLLAVIEAYPSLDSNTRKTFQETITANTASLDDLYLQSTAAENLASRASIACAAAQLVFGTSTVIPGSSNYTAEKHGNWFDPP